MGPGFIVQPSEAEHLGLGSRPGLEKHIKPYRNGRDLTSRSRGAMVIDLFGKSGEKVRREFPEVYQHLIQTVKAKRQEQFHKSPTKDALTYLENWWIFGKPRSELRPALAGLGRYIATVETAKHRVFQFLDASILADNMIVVMASDDAATLSILSSRIHTAWAPIVGGWLGYGNDPRYSKSRCFDPFPFPDPAPDLRQKLRVAGEELDATRKRVLADNPDLTLTGLYNVLERLKALRPGEKLSGKEEDVKARGLVLILKELHETIDRLSAQAYGWPADLADEQILERLVALNAERAREEAAGHVRWLRPEYQIPRFAKGAAARTGALDFGENVVAIDKALPAWPSDRYEQPLAVEAVLSAAGRPMEALEIARGFRRGGRRTEHRVAQVLVTLARYGRVTHLPGDRFAARKAA
ncbi:type IIL restriction-modification enzyme MmeI [Pseudaminobacter salicylatoxidans]|uniref:type IIL restriction-modification enzyme MmeI n=1 Tax=Pseudaminobacter salicylatoxidans TaxID=93369 RepID=UPI0002E95D5C